MIGVGHPSAAFLGRGAARLGLQAIRRSAGRPDGGPALLICWGGGPRRRAQPPSLRPSARAGLRRLRVELPDDWVATLDGRVVVIDVPAEHAAADALGELVVAHEGPLAIAVGVPRSDAVDRVLRMVDELVLVEPAAESLLTLARDELESLTTSFSVVAPPPPRFAALTGAAAGDEAGQATVVAVAVVATLLAIAVALGLVASALGRASDVQGRADVAALAGAKAMLAAQSALYSADPAARISPAEYRSRGLAAARASAAINGLALRSAEFVGDAELPTQLRLAALATGARRADAPRVVTSTAEVDIAPLEPSIGVGEYPGPFAIRQGERMRPDVALAFDRLNRAARAAGHPLVITSAFRSDAEQAELWRRHPDPKWVAPPGTSLHRLGTELDLGPNSAWAWLAANGTRFGFIKRYAWEAWHFGFTRSPGSASVGYRDRGAGSGERAIGATGAIPAFVPARFAPMISRTSQRWSVGAALLAAQLSVESQFDPSAVSPAGAAGIAQFMPGTAAKYGLTPAERFDPAKAIDAQGHLMSDLLRSFGSVPLALAAYNAGDGRVAACMCVPPIPETQGYVQKILALLGAAGLAAPAGLQIRLVA